MAKRILIIDDDADVLDVMNEALTYEGFEVRTESDANDVLSLVEEYKPDILILDHMLMGTTGGEICRQIKKDRKNSNLPVVIMSAYPGVIESSDHYDCDAFIPKPFNLDDLVGKINELTTRHSDAGQAYA